MEDRDQSWDEALRAPEEVGAPPDAGALARIVIDVRQLLGEVRVFENAEYLELDHEATGIQVSLYGGSAAITVPYWYKGAHAGTIAGQIYEVGLIIERHTGMAG